MLRETVLDGQSRLNAVATTPLASAIFLKASSLNRAAASRASGFYLTSKRKSVRSADSDPKP